MKGNIIAIIFMILLFCAIMGLEIYIWITYGDKPVDEIPLWAIWFLFGGD